ncbi:MAG: Do family serine endopeptidase [Rhodospirillaceae bacterium]|nr:Do family serine endopeptidase [Rhodospirillaceae bacterium]
MSSSQPMASWIVVWCRAIVVAAVAAVHSFPVAAQSGVPTSRQQISLSFAPVVEAASPAVVNIYTKRVVRRQAPLLFDDPFFRRFFGDAFGQQFGQPTERIQNSLGSGVVVRASGVVITNNHVVEGADQITVALSDRREFEAKLVGRDDRTDLAVLQIEGATEPLPFLDLADSDDLKVGDLVLAIGNPFNVGQTVTFGIVSAVARANTGVSDVGSFIQTDAAINPGNSGGALIASDGRLVGINTAIFSQSGGNIGIGFAIPANLVKTVLAGILSEGRAVRPWLGASGKSVSADIAKAIGLARPAGVVVERVVPRSPAARAGLAVGDVITAVNSKPIADDNELRFALATQQVGTRATFTVVRDGKDRQVAVSMEAPPEDPPRDTTTLGGRQPLSGATIANFNPALADEYRLPFDEPAVIVMGVAAGSIANRLGFQPGDKIVAVNDREIGSVEDLKDVVSAPAPSWTITLNRGGQILQTTIGG